MTFNISTNPMTVANWDTINSQQAYRHKPAAALGVTDSSHFYRQEPVKKESKLKSVAKFVGVLAVVAGALALSRAKIKSLKDIDVNNGEAYKGMAKAKYYTAKAGQWIIDKANAVKKIFIKTDKPPKK